MKTPPFLLGATLLFWGWQAGYFIFAAAMAVIVEGARYTTFRLDLSLTDFQRVADACSLILLGTIIYRYLAGSLVAGDFLPLRWLPISLFPLLVAQVYSTEGTIDLRALFLLLRKKRRFLEQHTQMQINIMYPYGALCILAAGAGNLRTAGFYIGLLVLSAWAFWDVRSPRYSLLVWSSLFLLAGGLGYVGHAQLHQLQRSLEESATLLRWLREFDPYQSSTAIGYIGTVKLSNKVMFRVKSDSIPYPSLLLRETSYPIYTSSKWLAPNAKFTRVFPDSDQTTWKLHEKSTQGQQVTVSSYLKRGKTILKVPAGTFQIDQLLVGNMEVNPYGAIKVEEGPGLISYQALFSPSDSIDSPPDERDTGLPPDEEAVFRSLAEKLGLHSLSQDEVVRRVAVYFQEHFSYSLELMKQAEQTTPLADFLHNSRRGHCEYFATATVLLLRAAGIPARYAVGYAVEDLRPGTWAIVRGSDAHAWTQVYLNGNWQDFDTTPASWRGIEASEASPFEWLSNFWARIRFAFSDWRWRQRQGGNEPYLIGALIILLLLLGWRLYKRRRKTPISSEPQAQETNLKSFPGLDSAFYMIERNLQAQGLTRYDWEPLSHWLKRIETHPSSSSLQALRPLLELHYRYRFDPEGLATEEQTSLHASVQAWLAQQ